MDLFGGSGPTAEACILEGFGCVIIERSRKYTPYIVQRINRRLDPVAAVAATRKADAADVDLFSLLGVEMGPVAPVEDTREGEASAERRYTDKGGPNFAAKPGRRRRD